KLLTDIRYGRSSLGRIHRNTHQFRTSSRQVPDLDCSTHRIRRIRIGHRLHNNRCITTDTHFSLAMTDNSRTTGTTCPRAGSYRRTRHRHFTSNLATLLAFPFTSSDLPRTRTLTPAALPITSDIGPGKLKDSVVPALKTRETKILSSARRISTQLSSLTSNTMESGPTATAGALSLERSETGAPLSGS